MTGTVVEISAEASDNILSVKKEALPLVVRVAVVLLFVALVEPSLAVAYIVCTPRTIKYLSPVVDSIIGAVPELIIVADPDP